MGHGTYRFGNNIVLEAREGFICLQVYFWGKRWSWGRLLEKPKYYSQGKSLTAQEWNDLNKPVIRL